MASGQALRLAVISSRFPWPAIRGDCTRAVVWLETLQALGSVTLIAPAGVVPSEFAAIEHMPVGVSAGALARGAGRALLGGLPLQSLAPARFDWSRRLEAFEFDAAVVLLSRTHPAVRPALRSRFTVLDAVDSLARSAEERAAASAGPARIFWSIESRLMRRLEQRVARSYDSVIVISDEDRDVFGPGSQAVPNGVTLRPPYEGAREFDFVFWGRIAYFANRKAAEVLVRRIWPLIRRSRPEATLLIAGADAPRSILAMHGRDGITVLSPVVDRSATLRRARIALFPMSYGTGQSNKLLEAAEAGCAIVATPKALRGLPHLAEAALCGDTNELADLALQLIANPDAIAARGRAARAAVERHDSRASVCRSLASIIANGVRR